MIDYAQTLEKLRTPHKLGRLLLAPSYRAGAFDSHAVDSAFIFRHDNRYWMTFIGWDSKGYQTGLAYSDNLLDWTKHGIILGRQADHPVLRYNAALTSILRDNELFGSSALKMVDGRYWGTYHAYPEAGYEEGAAVIGLCHSTDLLHWKPMDPVLRPEEGAKWERGGLYKSFLMEDRGVFYLFYNAKDQLNWPWHEQTGVAMSTDRMHWQRHADNPLLPRGGASAFDERFASDPVVLRVGGVWVMFYFGLAEDGKARDGAAFSRDLIHWEKSGEILVDAGPPDSIDSRHAHKPGIVGTERGLFHFYTAVAPSAGKLGEIEQVEKRGIALATSAVQW